VITNSDESSIDAFLRSYSPSERGRIVIDAAVDAPFLDRNSPFRKSVIRHVIAYPEAASPSLLQDLFVEEACWAERAGIVSPSFTVLAEILLNRTGTTYLTEFLTGFFASFNTFGACHQMNLGQATTSTLLKEIRRRLQSEPSASERVVLEAGEALLMKLQSGTAKEGWYSADGPLKVEAVWTIGPIRRAWLNTKAFCARKLGRNPWL
jgi:hypothetical protein